MPVADWKTFKIYGKIWLWKKKIIRISYQKAHHFPASCVLCKFLRFIEQKKYIWLIPNPLSRKWQVNKVTPWSSIRWKPTPWSNLRVAHETTPLDIYFVVLCVFSPFFQLLSMTSGCAKQFTICLIYTNKTIN